MGWYGKYYHFHLPSFALPVWNTPHLCPTLLPSAAIIGGWYLKIGIILVGSKEKFPRFYEKQDMNNYLGMICVACFSGVPLKHVVKYQGAGSICSSKYFPLERWWSITKCAFLGNAPKVFRSVSEIVDVMSVQKLNLLLIRIRVALWKMAQLCRTLILFWHTIWWRFNPPEQGSSKDSMWNFRGWCLFLFFMAGQPTTPPITYRTVPREIAKAFFSGLMKIHWFPFPSTLLNTLRGSVFRHPQIAVKGFFSIRGWRRPAMKPIFLTGPQISHISAPFRSTGSFRSSENLGDPTWWCLGDQINSMELRVVGSF